MKIGLDLDNTLFNLPDVETASKILGMYYTSEDVTSWSMTELPEILFERIRELWFDETFMCNLSLIPGVKETLSEWHDQGHELYIITARIKKLTKPTKNMVDEKLPGLIKSIHVSGFSESKIDIMKDLNLDLWIDDSPHGIDDSLAEKFKTIMISNSKTKYNHHYRSDVPWVNKLTEINLNSYL